MKILDQKNHLTDTLERLVVHLSHHATSLLATDQYWELSATMHDGGAAYALRVRNDGMGRPEFIRFLYDGGDRRQVLTSKEYEALQDTREKMEGKVEMDDVVVDGWLPYPSVYEELRLRWEAVQRLVHCRLY